MKKDGRFKKGHIPWNKGGGKVVQCVTCKKEFYLSQCRINFGIKCCSRICGLKMRGNYCNTGRTWFKRGHKPWNWKGGISKSKSYSMLWKHKRRAMKLKNGGKFTLKEWGGLKKKYKFTCPGCFKLEPEIKLVVDHIIPLCKGGRNDIKNIQPLCRDCNAKKYTKTRKYNSRI